MSVPIEQTFSVNKQLTHLGHTTSMRIMLIQNHSWVDSVPHGKIPLGIHYSILGVLTSLVSRLENGFIVSGVYTLSKTGIQFTTSTISWQHVCNGTHTKILLVHLVTYALHRYTPSALGIFQPKRHHAHVLGVIS